jgi:hypothetical protein
MYYTYTHTHTHTHTPGNYLEGDAHQLRRRGRHRTTLFETQQTSNNPHTRLLPGSRVYTHTHFLIVKHDSKDTHTHTHTHTQTHTYIDPYTYTYMYVYV